MKSHLFPLGQDRSKAGRTTGVLVGFSLSVLVPSLATSIANAGLPTMARVFNVPFQQAQWIVLAYLVANTALIVGAGRLGDLLGPRRILLFGLGVFTLASVLAAGAPSISVLVIARASQGIGASMMLALSVALVGQYMPSGRAGTAMGLLGSMSAVGTTLGAPLGGYLTASYGWRAMFLVCVPLTLAALILLVVQLPKDRTLAMPAKSFDWGGTATLAFSLASVALALTNGLHTTPVMNLALMIAGSVALAAFSAIERQAASPLIDLELLQDKGLNGSLFTGMVVSAVVMATLVIGPFYLTHGLTLPLPTVAYSLAVGPFVAMVAGVPAGRLVDRYGAPRMTVISLFSMSAGLSGLVFGRPGWGLPAYLTAVSVVTAAYSMFQASQSTTVMGFATAGNRGRISGLLNVSRNMGLFFGASIMSTVFGFATAQSGMGASTPAATVFGMRAAFAFALAFVLIALVLTMTRPRRSTALR